MYFSPCFLAHIWIHLFECVMSRMNTSCHTWMSLGGGQRWDARGNDFCQRKPCQKWKNHVTYEHVIPHLDHSRWCVSPVKDGCEREWLLSKRAVSHFEQSSPIWVRHVTRVLSHVNVSCHTDGMREGMALVTEGIWIRHVTDKYVMSHTNTSCHIQIRHVTYKYVMSHISDSRWGVSKVKDGMQEGMPSVKDIHLTYGGVMSHVNTSFDRWMSLGGVWARSKMVCERECLLLKTAMFIWRNHVPYEYVLSHIHESRWGVSTVKDGMREGMTSVKEGIKGLAEDMKELVLGNQRTNSFVSIASWYVCVCVCRDSSVWHDSFVCHDSVVLCDMTRLPGNQRTNSVLLPRMSNVCRSCAWLSRIVWHDSFTRKPVHELVCCQCCFLECLHVCVPWLVRVTRLIHVENSARTCLSGFVPGMSHVYVPWLDYLEIIARTRVSVLLPSMSECVCVVTRVCDMTQLLSVTWLIHSETSARTRASVLLLSM